MSSSIKFDAWVKRVFEKNLKRLFPHAVAEDEWDSDLGKLFRSGWHAGSDATKNRLKKTVDHAS